MPVSAGDRSRLTAVARLCAAERQLLPRPDVELRADARGRRVTACSHREGELQTHPRHLPEATRCRKAVIAEAVFELTTSSIAAGWSKEQ
jgi:hypothetical protein